jgi:SSS family solute:Na+ symporter
MENISKIDLFIVALYLVLMIGVGLWFSRKNKSSENFTRALGRIPGWAIGISLYATFLSSNTFIGVPGKAFGSNWSSLVFSIAMPLSAWVAAKYFVPHYRKIGGISAYSNLEARFGSWARIYAVSCFILMQFARMGSIFFGTALTLQAFTGYPMATIMLVTGVCIIIYTVLGGIEAVIWTEVIQAILKTVGGLAIIFIIFMKLDAPLENIISTGIRDSKFSLGSFSLDFTSASFWVVFLYGFFMNLKAFGFDQNYVQRYHTAISEKEAVSSVWLCVKLYVPISLMFFFLGTCLYGYYDANPQELLPVKMAAASEILPAGASQLEIATLANTLKPADYGDKVMPYFIVHMLPVGLVGLIISALLSAAMSTISSGMNASATVFLEDIFKRHIRPDINEKQGLKLLYVATTVFGLVGMGFGIAMIGAKSILDLWWELSGIFAGGMLGLFLLGFISDKVSNSSAVVATLTGICVILWMALSKFIPSEYAFLKNTLHANMIIVVGTLVIYFVGTGLTWIKASKQ